MSSKQSGAGSAARASPENNTQQTSDTSSTQSQPQAATNTADSDGLLDTSTQCTAAKQSVDSDGHAHQILFWLTNAVAGPVLCALMLGIIAMVVTWGLMSSSSSRSQTDSRLMLILDRSWAVTIHGLTSAAHHAFLWYMINLILHWWETKRQWAVSIALVLLVLEGILLCAYMALLDLMPLFTRWVKGIDLDLNMYNNYFGAWRTGFQPQTFRGCDLRVLPQQSPLFETEYNKQFPRMSVSLDFPWRDWPEYSEELFFALRDNATLCSQGFEANGDLYGLGIRLGIYLQWLSALISNQLLLENRDGIQKAYLIFNISICAATFVSTFTLCTFGVEIQILYWLYWGGVICVFASAPSKDRLEGQSQQWVALDWSTGIQYCNHLLMTYHFFWYIHYGYDQVFARMPCGTQHFFSVRVTDPSTTYCYVRDTLAMLSIPPMLAFLLPFPLIMVCLTSEIWVSVRASYIMQSLCAALPVSSTTSAANFDAMEPAIATFSERLQHQLQGIYKAALYLHRRLRLFFRFPAQPMKGIRLITPFDIPDRRNYRVRCAVLAVTSFGLSTWAIESTLKWNKVVDVYSISSTGQYLALIIGLGTFISVLGQLRPQGMQEPRATNHGQAPAAADEYEMDDLPSTVVDSVQHVPAQPNAESYRPDDLQLESDSPSSSVYCDAQSTRSSLDDLTSYAYQRLLFDWINVFSFIPRLRLRRSGQSRES